MAEVDPYNLQRFVDAQDAIYERVTGELKNGKKESHWMWFVFPQFEGLGSSPLARKFAISSREEAIQYLKHPILGSRLRDCSRIVTLLSGRSAEDIFGSTDCLKFRSCMTLFHVASDGEEPFRNAIDKYFNGEMDLYTCDKLCG
jgi:uncharacterized protein (DUF1810 family)